MADRTDRQGELDALLAPLREAAVPQPLARAVQDMLSGVDEDAAGGRVDALDRGLRTLVEAAGVAREELAALAGRRSRAEPFGEAWWERLREGGTDRDARWVRAFVEAVLAQRYDVALRLAAPAEGLAPRELAAPALAGAEHLMREELAGAAEVLLGIVDGPWAGALDPADRADLEILLARARLESPLGQGDPRDRLRAGAEAAARDGEPALRGRLLAMIGECAVSLGELDAAESAFAEAIDLVPDELGALVGLGMLAERRADWGTAARSYDRAAKVADDVEALERLHAPVPGNVYWRLARRLAAQPSRAEEAIGALDKAIDHGMRGGEPYQERRAYVDKAYLLEHQRRPEEAASAFSDGALRYVWTDQLQTAQGLLERAVELAPDGAEHRWLLAEVLRLIAQRPDGSADRELIAQALDHWRAGRRARPPVREEAWAYTTYALATYDDVQGTSSERHRVWEVAAAAERAVLLDPDLPGGWSLVSMAYLDLALPHAALEAARRAADVHPEDPAAGYYLYQALLSVGRVDEALAALTADDEAWAGVGRALVHVVRDEPEQALAVLGPTEGLEPSNAARIVRALSLVHLGRDEDAVAEVAHWPNPLAPDSASNLHVAAWVAYLRGQLDRADELLGAALDDDPAEAAAVLLDRGQVLLARGGPGDLGEGERLAAEGVRLCTRWERLKILLAAELPLLLRRVTGLDHERATGEVVARLRTHAADRLGELGDGHRDAVGELRDVLATAPPDAAEAHAAHPALARMLLADDPEAALDHYRATAEAGSGAAWEGVVAACVRARDVADAGTRGPEAHLAYARLADALAAVPEDAPAFATARSLHTGLVVRAAVHAVLADEPGTAARLLSAAEPPDGADDEVASAVGAVVRDGAAYWALTDSLARHREGLGGWAATLSGAASLDAVYRTRRVDVDMTKVFPLESPVYVHLGPGLVPEDTGPDWVLFSRLIPEMRERIRARAGVTIPGIRFFSGELRHTEYEVRLGHRLVRAGDTAAEVTGSDDADALRELLGDLESVLLQCLERLFGPDDLLLWVTDLDPTGELERAPDVAPLLGDREGRLWTHRVLRMLVREGVPLDDGEQLLRDVAVASADSGGDVLAAVARVRAARRDRVPGTAGPVPLPAHLEREVAAGLQEGGATAVWQLPWTQAVELVRAVREWQATQAAPRAVSVTDARVRNYLWRLLAPGGRWTHVVTEREAADAEPAPPGATARTEGP